MPRKTAMRESVSAVRSQLPHLSNLPREKIELALLYYECNIEETVKAFKENGAIEALSGWTEMGNGRGSNSSKRAHNKTITNDNKTITANNVLRPSQRVSHIFQTFAEGGIPTMTTDGSRPVSTTDSHLSSFKEQMHDQLEAYSPIESSSYSCLNEASTTNNPVLLSDSIASAPNDFHGVSSETISDQSNPLSNHSDEDKHNGKVGRRRSTRNSNGSISSATLNHDSNQPTLTIDNQQSTNGSISTTAQTVHMPSSSSSSTTIFSNNRKLLTKSTKDLQRQTSTLTNVELSFENEIKSSVKRIDEIFKQIRDIIKEREIELYLEIDKVKEQGLHQIHHRQQRASELRLRIDRCDRLDPSELDILRNDIKQFVTDRRYDLGEELISSHRFQYDQTIIDSLKTFGTVHGVNRKEDRAHASSMSSTLIESSDLKTEKVVPGQSIGCSSASLENDRVSTATSVDQSFSSNRQKPLPQRTQRRQQVNGTNDNNRNNNTNGDHHENSNISSPTNGFHYYHDDTNNFKTVSRRRPPQQKQASNFNESTRRVRPNPANYNNNNNNNKNNNRRHDFNNSENRTIRRPVEASQTNPSSTNN